MKHERVTSQITLFVKMCGISEPNLGFVLCDCRVDGKDVINVPQRRLSFDCKTSKPVFTQQSDIISHTTSREDMDKVDLYLSSVDTH